MTSPRNWYHHVYLWYKTFSEGLKNFPLNVIYDFLKIEVVSKNYVNVSEYVGVAFPADTYFWNPEISRISQYFYKLQAKRDHRRD